MAKQRFTDNTYVSELANGMFGVVAKQDDTVLTECRTEADAARESADMNRGGVSYEPDEDDTDAQLADDDRRWRAEMESSYEPAENVGDLSPHASWQR